MTLQSIRWKLSIKLGVIGGLVWSLLFASYYTMLPYITISQEKRFTFAWQSASICFIALIVIILGLPYIRDIIKGVHK